MVDLILARECSDIFTGVDPELAGMRREYTGDGQLDESWLVDGWHRLLRDWIEDARAAAVAEPNAMVLATVDDHGHPSTRTVLCKAITDTALVFFTNYSSAKAHDLSHQRHASATFSWPAIGRQVHVAAVAGRISANASDDYWRTRPRDSQLGAWASQQSTPIRSREDLAAHYAVVAHRFADVAEIPRPDGWGGFELTVSRVEFWQGQKSRLHNRIRADLIEGTWRLLRLQP